MMIFNLVLLSLLPLALAAAVDPFANDAFCNPAGANDVFSPLRRVCFLDLSGKGVFTGSTPDLGIDYSADRRYVLVTMDPHTPGAELDSEKAKYILTYQDGGCTDVEIQWKTTAPSWRRKVCNGDGTVIVCF